MLPDQEVLEVQNLVMVFFKKNDERLFIFIVQVPLIIGYLAGKINQTQTIFPPSYSNLAVLILGLLPSTCPNDILPGLVFVQLLVVFPEYLEFPFINIPGYCS